MSEFDDLPDEIKMHLLLSMQSVECCVGSNYHLRLATKLYHGDDFENTVTMCREANDKLKDFRGIGDE